MIKYNFIRIEKWLFFYNHKCNKPLPINEPILLLDNIFLLSSFKLTAIDDLILLNKNFLTKQDFDLCNLNIKFNVFI